MKKRRIYRFALLLLFGGCLGVFLYSASHVSTIRAGRSREQAAFQRLAELVSENLQATDPESDSPGETQSSDAKTDSSRNNSSQRQPLEQYLLLYEQNKDYFGWLRIDGTQINYPVMFTPWDSEYYLRRSFDGTSSTSGTPFLDGACDPEGSYYLIYGHHLSGGTMFAELPNYKDPEYARAHPLIHLDTRYEEREYEVVSAFYSQIRKEEAQGVFRYYAYQDLSEPALFEEFWQGVQASALYDLGVRADYGDELLTLSTCSYHTQDGRFAVLAKRRR